MGSLSYPQLLSVGGEGILGITRFTRGLGQPATFRLCSVDLKIRATSKLHVVDQRVIKTALIVDGNARITKWSAQDLDCANWIQAAGDVRKRKSEDAGAQRLIRSIPTTASGIEYGDIDDFTYHAALTRAVITEVGNWINCNSRNRNLIAKTVGCCTNRRPTWRHQCYAARGPCVNQRRDVNLQQRIDLSTGALTRIYICTDPEVTDRVAIIINVVIEPIGHGVFADCSRVRV